MQTYHFDADDYLHQFEAKDDARAFEVAQATARAEGRWIFLYRGPIRSGLRPIVKVDPRGGIAMRDTAA